MKRFFALLLASIALVTLPGCETTGQTTMLGAGIGAASAALTGHSALRGAAIGAGSGFVLGKIVKHERERAYEDGYYEGRYAGRAGGYPVARRTGTRGIVISPYAPYNQIDVRGIPSGARVKDPSTNRIFINP
jgi:hypothetical protein